MDEDIIYCTEEQTRKAYELGLSLNFGYHQSDFRDSVKIRSLLYVEIPTAEKMVALLEGQGVLVDVGASFDQKNTPLYLYRIGISFNNYFSNAIDYHSRKEATLAAIDATLNYLSNNAQ